MRFSGTLVIKFRSKRTTIDFSLTCPVIFGSGVSSTKELPGRERSLSTSLNAYEIVASSCLSYSIVSCHTWK